MAPRNPDLHAVLGVLHNLSRDYPAAIASFEVRSRSPMQIRPWRTRLVVPPLLLRGDANVMVLLAFRRRRSSSVQLTTRCGTSWAPLGRIRSRVRRPCRAIFERSNSNPITCVPFPISASRMATYPRTRCAGASFLYPDHYSFCAASPRHVSGPPPPPPTFCFRPFFGALTASLASHSCEHRPCAFHMLVGCGAMLFKSALTQSRGRSCLELPDHGFLGDGQTRPRREGISARPLNALCRAGRVKRMLGRWCCWR